MRAVSHRRLPRIRALAACGLLSAFLAGCATPPAASDPEALAEFRQTNDPIEPTNRVFYKINDGIDKVVLKPVAQAYRYITPVSVRTGVHNVLTNLGTPVQLTNDMLQGKPRRAGDTTMRFLINTTAGVLGIFDVAKDLGYPEHDTDFGLTLAKWGVPEGPYLVLPLFGSSTGRDAAAFPVDRFLFNPLSWYARSHSFNLHAEYLPTVAYLVTVRASAIDAEGLLEGAYDPYVFYRDAYRQRRLYKIYRGEPPMEVIQSMQGVDDVEDSDRLLEEQQQYEKQHKKPDDAASSKP